MDFQRIILIGALVLVSFGLWNAWQKDYPHALAQPANNQALSPSTMGTPPVAASAGLVTAAATPAINNPDNSTLIQIKTDVLNVGIDLTGGNIVQASLPAYPKEVGNPTPFPLLSADPNTFYVAQSGLLSKLGPDTAQGQAKYVAAKNRYTLAPGQDQLVVEINWQNKQGLRVTKSFTFKKGDYAVKVDYQITNQATVPWSGQFYTQLKRKKLEPASKGLFSISSYTGAAISSPEKLYEKVSFDKMDKENLQRTIKGGWAAMQEHYFLSAWIPEQQQTAQYYSSTAENLYTIGMIGPVLELPPGKQLKVGATLYTGPTNCLYSSTKMIVAFGARMRPLENSNKLLILLVLALGLEPRTC